MSPNASAMGRLGTVTLCLDLTHQFDPHRFHHLKNITCQNPRYDRKALGHYLRAADHYFAGKEEKWHQCDQAECGAHAVECKRFLESLEENSHRPTQFRSQGWMRSISEVTRE